MNGFIDTKYHKLLLILHWMILLGIALIGWMGYRSLAGLPWKTVRIYTNCQQITHEKLKVLIARNLHRDLVQDSLFKIREELCANPWVRKAKVARRWPGTLEVDVVERHPVAVWLDRTLIDDKDGRIDLNLAGQPLPQLVHLVGSEQHFQYILDNYRQLLPLAKEQGWQILNLEEHSGGYWRVKLSIGVELFFFNKNLVKQFARFVKLYPQIVQRHGDVPQYVDFRYKNGNFAVK